MASMSRVMRLLPVPVTAFSQTVENDIIVIAMVRTRTTGIACSIKLSSCPNTERSTRGNALIRRQRTNVAPVLMDMIFTRSGSTLSCLPWPIILLTMEALVAANAQLQQPVTPKIFRMILEMARASCP